jgi:chromosome segregation ATPase
MNLVGKIFVVLILVMSLVFMGFAVAVYATHKNWKETVDRPENEAGPGKPLGLKYQLLNLQAKNTELAGQVAALKKESETVDTERRQRIANLESTLQGVRDEHDRYQNENALLKQGERQAVLATQQAQQMLDKSLAAIEGLRNDIFEAYKDRDAKFKNAVDLTDKLIEKESEVERLKTNKLNLLKMVAVFKTRAAAQGININTPVDYIPPPLDGEVLASRANGLVEVSLGSDDGLQAHQEALIYRGEKFIAKIEIVQATPDKSVGKVIPSYKKGPIERDDRVVTKLP